MLERMGAVYISSPEQETAGRLAVLWETGKNLSTYVDIDSKLISGTEKGVS